MLTFSNLRPPALLPLLVLIAFAAALVSPAEAGQKEKVKKAKKVLDGFAALESKALRKTNELTLKEFELTIELLALQVELESVTTDAAALAAAEALAHAVAAQASRAQASRDVLEAFASQQLQVLGFVPKAYCLGTFGTWDDALADVQDEVERADAKLEKKLKAFAKTYEKLAPTRSLLLRRVPVDAPAPIAPGAGAPTVQQAPIRLRALAAASVSAVVGDGFACVRGSADPAANGGQVAVRLTDGAGFEVDQVVPVAGDGSFVACFPAAGPSDLAEGNYRVVVHQGGAETVAGISVP